MLVATRPTLLVHTKATSSKALPAASSGRPFSTVANASPTYFFPLTSPVSASSSQTSVPLQSGHPRRARYTPVLSDEPKSMRALDEPTDNIPRLREALRSVETKMATLAREQQRLTRALEQAVRVVAPVMRLPPELLSKVFRTGILESDEKSSDPLLLPTIMRVCKQWRNVAVNTPLLWARIAIGPHDSLEVARRRLLRSKDAPLDIVLDFDKRTGQASVFHDLMEAMDLVLPAIVRWRSFRLTAATRSDANAALTLCRRSAPLLTSLTVHVTNSLQEDPEQRDWEGLFGGHAPLLRYCSLASFDLGWDNRLLSDLRVLKLNGYWSESSPSAATILNLLRANPTLEEFTLRNLYDEDSDFCLDGRLGFESVTRRMSVPAITTSSPYAVHLPLLRRLVISAAGSARVRSLMTQLAFPSLQELEISCLDDVTVVLEQLQRQAPLPLKRLRIESCDFDQVQLLRLLQSSTGLATLELVDVHCLSPQFFKVFAAPPPGQRWLCPQLDRLSVEGCPELDDACLRSVVQSRMPNHTRHFSTSNPRIDCERLHESPACSILPGTETPVHVRSMSSPPAARSASSGWPTRLRHIDISRCHQFSKAMVSWLIRAGCEVKADHTLLS